MSASSDHRGVTAGVAALALVALLASPAWGQSGSQTSESDQPAATEAQTGARPGSQPAGTAASEQAAPEGEGTPAAESAATTEPSADAVAATPEAGADYVVGDVALGDPDAPLTVYEYASFTCPHCATFHEQTFPEFREKYIDTGKVRFVLREVYFDQYGLWASMVARCGGEQGFYPLVDAFLGLQETWTRAPDIGHAISQVGRRAGLPAERLQQCLSDREFAKELLENYQENREADDIQSTPTFVINGEKHTGAMDFESFSAILDAEL
jgi:protein-disulfide isomerase